MHISLMRSVRPDSVAVGSLALSVDGTTADGKPRPSTCQHSRRPRRRSFPSISGISRTWTRTSRYPRASSQKTWPSKCARIRKMSHLRAKRFPGRWMRPKNRCWRFVSETIASPEPDVQPRQANCSDRYPHRQGLPGPWRHGVRRWPASRRAIEGNVRADPVEGSSLSVSETGSIDGNVEVGNVMLNGAVRGDIVARGRVVLGLPPGSRETSTTGSLK